jgi:hypothetical protein
LCFFFSEKELDNKTKNNADGNTANQLKLALNAVETQTPRKSTNHQQRQQAVYFFKFPILISHCNNAAFASDLLS